MDVGDVDCCPSCYSPADDAECDCHHSHHHHPFASAAAAAANALLNSNQHQNYTATGSPQPPSTPEALHQLMGASSASASSSSLDADFAAATCEGGVGMTHNDHIDHTGTGGVIFGIGIGVGCCDVDSNWDARSDAGSTRSSRGSTSREESENRLQQIKVIIKAPTFHPSATFLVPFVLSLLLLKLPIDDAQQKMGRDGSSSSSRRQSTEKNGYKNSRTAREGKGKRKWNVSTTSRKNKKRAGQ